jgi:hypothetical protein
MRYLYDYETKQIIDKSREGHDDLKERRRLDRKAERMGMKYGSHNRYRVTFSIPQGASMAC